jgi:hypothetical protein
MKWSLFSAFAVVLLGAAVARADTLPPPPPPKPPTKPKPAFDSAPIVAGTVAAAGAVLAGVWIARSRRLRFQASE